MSLTSGTRVGPYEIGSSLGTGGMGEVYRARDTGLKRDVAIKVLPANVASDRDRLSRFQREAKVLAAFNHPNIAAIYGLEEAPSTDPGTASVQALVMELVGGEDLAERISRGPIPVDEALPIAKQIADALEAAHEQGIVHRDLKPANIKVRSDGAVKVLDFGLARIGEASGAGRAGGADALLNSPTMTSPAMTQMGMILGTAAYMSPEQAKGKPVDKRADIWAFGCVLYEMLSGRRPFDGEDVTDTIVAVVTKTPEWTALPNNLPPSLRRLLRRLLEKDRQRRIRDIGDARLELDQPDDAGTPATRFGRRSRQIVMAAGWLFAAAALAALALTRARPAEPSAERLAPSRPAKFEIPIPSGSVVGGLAISPNGRTLVVEIGRSARGAGGMASDTRLYARHLDEFDIRPITGTEGAHQPFFSPDGKWVGFFADDRLKKVALDGGTPASICDAQMGWGASWAPDDTIVFTSPASSSSSITRILHRVGAQGGSITDLDTLPGSATARWPNVLSDGRTIGFSAFTSNSDAQAQLAFRRPDGTVAWLDDRGTAPSLAGGTHLAWARDGRLFVAPFDSVRLTVIGPPVAAVTGLAMSSFSGMAKYAVASDGTLAYVAGGIDGTARQIVTADTQSRLNVLPVGSRMFEQPAFSRDGRRFVVRTMETEETSGLWVGDVARPTLMRLTFTETGGESPVWSPDSKRIAFVAAAAGQGQGVYIKPSDDSGEAVLAWRTPNHVHVGDWSPDAQMLIVMLSDPQSLGDIWTVSLNGGPTAPWLKTRFSEREPRFSPDGRWVAYTSNESGRDEVYVRPYPGPGGKTQISTNGGNQPIWVRQAPALIYREQLAFMRVEVKTSPAFASTTPRQMFTGEFDAGPVSGQTSYDVSPDGRMLLLIRPLPSDTLPTLRVIVNWLAGVTNASQ